MTDSDYKPLRFLVHKGRGASSNAVSRFDHFQREDFDDGWGILDEEVPRLRTEVAFDATRKVITYNDSPDIPFDRTVNPYRGCEHGCIYCYARPSHAYLGLSPGLDFESRLQAKPDAAEILRKELAKPGYRCAPIALGMNTDAYQPIEREYRITRGILEVLAECRHPVSMVTKSALVERDLDLLAPMAKLGLATVYVTITTLDRSIARRLEPRAAAPERRLETLRRIAEAGIPTGVMVAPVIPALTDREMELIMEKATEAGAKRCGYVLLRLPYELVDLFEEWLRRHYPLKADHVLSLIRQSRGGKLYDANFKSRMSGEGLFAEMIAKRFHLACQRLQLNQSRTALRTDLFCPPVVMNPATNSTQMPLF
jgi:DNA repair photolyase